MFVVEPLRKTALLFRKADTKKTQKNRFTKGSRVFISLIF